MAVKTIEFDFGAYDGYEKIEKELKDMNIGVLGLFYLQFLKRRHNKLNIVTYEELGIIKLSFFKKMLVLPRMA